jgi:hypothetical protein
MPSKREGNRLLVFKTIIKKNPPKTRGNVHHSHDHQTPHTWHSRCYARARERERERDKATIHPLDQEREEQPDQGKSVRIHQVPTTKSRRGRENQPRRPYPSLISSSKSSHATTVMEAVEKRHHPPSPPSFPASHPVLQSAAAAWISKKILYPHYAPKSLNHGDVIK